MNSKNWFLLLFCLASLKLHAFTLVVSDIDDTIKTTHIAGSLMTKPQILANAVLTKNKFAGMSELYSQILLQNTDAQIIYLSAAPKYIASNLYSKFLRESNFPMPSNLVLKHILDDTFFYKTSYIQKWINEFKPSKLILVGDNGQKDEQIYKFIQDENKHLEIYSFIRVAYPLNRDFFNYRESNFQYFVSPLSIAEFLLNKEVLKAAETTSYVLDQLHKTNNISRQNVWSEQVFPFWMKCTNFNEDLRALSYYYPAHFAEIQKAETIINNRCQD